MRTGGTGWTHSTHCALGAGLSEWAGSASRAGGTLSTLDADHTVVAVCAHVSTWAGGSVDTRSTDWAHGTDDAGFALLARLSGLSGAAGASSDTGGSWKARHAGLTTCSL